jgi:hypothetical protein
VVCPDGDVDLDLGERGAVGRAAEGERHLGLVGQQEHRARIRAIRHRAQTVDQLIDALDRRGVGQRIVVGLERPDGGGGAAALGQQRHVDQPHALGNVHTGRARGGTGAGGERQAQRGADRDGQADE